MKWLVLLVVLATTVSAITIHGTIYDFDLTKHSAIVEINTSPAQRLVATNATYVFTVPAGTYTLRATSKDFAISEQIQAVSGGNYVLDLILLPSLDEEDALLAQNVEVPNVEQFIELPPSYSWIIGIILLALASLIPFALRHFRKPQITLQNDLQEIFDFIIAQGGRAQQKDIYHHFNYSEAKISLILDELEGRGLVKRIKKGRGNLIVRA